MYEARRRSLRPGMFFCACLAMGALTSGCTVVTIATTAVDLGVSAGSAAVDATATVAKGAVKATKAVAKAASSDDDKGN